MVIQYVHNTPITTNGIVWERLTINDVDDTEAARLLTTFNGWFVEYNEKSVQDPIQEPVEDPIQDPVEDPVQDPVQDPVDTAVNEPVAKKAKK